MCFIILRRFINEWKSNLNFGVYGGFLFIIFFFFWSKIFFVWWLLIELGKYVYWYSYEKLLKGKKKKNKWYWLSIDMICENDYEFLLIG